MTSTSPNPSRTTDAESAQTQVRRLRPTPRARRVLGAMLLVVCGMAITFGGLWLYRLYAPPPAPMTMEEVNAVVGQAMADATPPPAYSAAVYDVILPSLVTITTGEQAPDDGSMVRYQPNGTDRLQNPDEELPDGVGSGVVISADGAILTAFHLVAGANIINVTFADGTRTTAALAAAEPDNDIAVLLPKELPEIFAPATLGNPGALRIGDEAYAVGAPLGLAGSISAGVISGLNRTYTPPSGVPQLERLIQFDAAVNAGNSGGPLLNRNGEVVGIVVALINPTAADTFIGIGLAVRIDEAGTAAGLPQQ